MMDLENDGLLKLLQAGAADKAEQADAAELILWMAKFVPDEAARARRDGLRE